MTRREAKRRARRLVGESVLGLLSAGWPFEPSHGEEDRPDRWSPADQARLEEALRELADELLTPRR